VRDAANAAGIPLSEWTCKTYTVEAARQAFAAALAEQAQPPTAVVAANDMIALGVVQQALEQGIRVPEELSVVGFNDFDFSAWVRPSLTTVRIPAAEMGKYAVELLLGSDGVFVPTARVFPAELVVRESSGGAPSRPATG
jgi:LacI family transcriptional regulator